MPLSCMNYILKIVNIIKKELPFVASKNDLLGFLIDTAYLFSCSVIDIQGWLSAFYGI